MAAGLRAIGRNVVKRLVREDREARRQGLREKQLGDVVDDMAFWPEQKAEFLKHVGDQADALMRQGVAQAERLGLTVAFDVVNEQVLELSGQFMNNWWGALETSTRDTLRKAVQTNIATGAPLKSLVKSIAPTFGKGRAKMIAATEVTRLYAEGNRAAYAAAGVPEVEWRTVKDSLVDPICEALDGQRWPVRQEATVPPAHPNCRCWLAPVSEGRVRIKPVRAG